MRSELFAYRCVFYVCVRKIVGDKKKTRKMHLDYITCFSESEIRKYVSRNLPGGGEATPYEHVGTLSARRIGMGWG